MGKQNLNMGSRDYERIASVLAYMTDKPNPASDLASLAERIGLSEFHFQRLFSRWVGISPGRFLAVLRREHLRDVMARTRSLLDASLEGGLSGPGRLHDLFVQLDAVTPDEYRKMGAGLAIKHGIHDGPFGFFHLGVTDRGVCWLAFVDSPILSEEHTKQLAIAWPGAQLVCSPEETRAIAAKVFRGTSGDRLTAFVRGTNFQVKTWEALLRIPQSGLASYEDIAAHIGQPTAVRAVASAIARNPVGYLIPCHRVLRKIGTTHNYRWGAVRKQAMIGYEVAKGSRSIDQTALSSVRDRTGV